MQESCCGMRPSETERIDQTKQPVPHADDDFVLVAVVASAWNQVIELLTDQKPGNFSVAIQGVTQPIGAVSVCCSNIPAELILASSTISRAISWSPM